MANGFKNYLKLRVNWCVQANALIEAYFDRVCGINPGKRPYRQEEFLANTESPMHSANTNRTPVI